ncbi:hypothetical protein ACQ4PT_056723 [Festuca glaucescens]
MTNPGVVEAGCRAFIFFAVSGSVIYFVGGTLRSSSRGCRLAGGVQAVITNGPRVRRSAAWHGLKEAIYLGIQRMCRADEGPVNTMVACGAASALFSIHLGTRAAVYEWLKGAAYGGLIEIAACGLVALINLRASSV